LDYGPRIDEVANGLLPFRSFGAAVLVQSRKPRSTRTTLKCLVGGDLGYSLDAVEE
jgi:hypothetical protein